MPPVPFLQAVADAVASVRATGITIETLAISFTGLVLAGLWREGRAFMRKIDQWQTRVDTTLFGPEGNNGLNGAVRDHEHRLRVLEHHDTTRNRGTEESPE